jgi:hypothetical protein
LGLRDIFATTSSLLRISRQNASITPKAPPHHQAGPLLQGGLIF